MSSLIPHDYRYKISSPTPVDKEPKLKGLAPITYRSQSLTAYFFGSIIFGVGDSHTSFIWNKK